VGGGAAVGVVAGSVVRGSVDAVGAAAGDVAVCVGGSVGGGAAVGAAAGAAATVTMVAPSIEEALKMASRDEIFVIGGGEIYRQTMPGAYRLYITSVKTIIDDADTYFPKIDSSKWRIIWESEVFHDTKTNFDFQFIQYLTNEN
ncbi:MAG: dihydrofolate reductase, partial [Bacteroidales bacterium]|nr:dihydrofolate reductase [Bacteroidales bacterium]